MEGREIKLEDLVEYTETDIFTFGSIRKFIDNDDFDFFIKNRQNFIKQLEFFENQYLENQALKDRWQKLKEFIETSNKVLLYSIEDKPAKLGNKKYNYFERKQLLDKIQELEKEIK